MINFLKLLCFSFHDRRNDLGEVVNRRAYCVKGFAVFAGFGMSFDFIGLVFKGEVDEKNLVRLFRIVESCFEQLSRWALRLS
jgi:hypothetical protein